MEKIGLITEEITPAIEKICRETERISKNRYQIGYCYLYAAAVNKALPPYSVWSAEQKVAFPDRLQEVLRNCDVLLVMQSEKNDICTLPLMTAKDTFILLPHKSDPASAPALTDTAKEYGTAVCFGDLADSEISEKIVRFFAHES